MSSFVTTESGDRIAFDRRGTGPALIFVAGAGPWREIDSGTSQTGELLAGKGFTTVVYDRPGRGESVAEGPFTLERELSALAALIDEVGGSAVLCGHSSGCSISLLAAARGLPIAGLALWEAPLAPPHSGADDFADELRHLITAGELENALSFYMRDMPPEILDIVKTIPAMIGQAATLQPDADSLAWAESAPLSDLLSERRMPVLAMVGTSSFDDVMVPAAEMIVTEIPNAEWKRVPGANHDWEPGPMADELAEFLARIPR
ncbi:alpha/beta fold hydrolase [Mycetocola zhadangensis]|uniref:Alpha/beta hydrolase n=1 Tax=Mycetocola zhadangensis TaxID=1164595 RepID=A0A3L7J7D2_9MICO|nr:alpha/beta hydrolase [Mycetocola zhadangensis]RLQ86379.1 alpha/beta hydrolase [Mycetocola zhadangensis]GGE90701.1 alpha/beta hydrolase [Mycetocola zhadangensis]